MPIIIQLTSANHHNHHAFFQHSAHPSPSMFSTVIPFHYQAASLFLPFPQHFPNISKRINKNHITSQIILYTLLKSMDNLVAKTFVFQHESSSKTQNLDVSLQADSQLIDIKHIIGIWKQKNEIVKPMQFKIYDPQINRYVPLNPEVPIMRGVLYSPVIMIKYGERQVGAMEDDVDSQVSSKASEETKRERNRERSIREVLEYVKQWRQIHNTLDKHNNKINLQDAAKMVGISKKSLDDYYCQLRLAEEYGFNFYQNIQQKIGLLRTFVKERRGKGDSGVKHERLPKKLRILEEIGNGLMGTRSTEEEEIKMELEGPGETIIESQYEPPMAVIPEDQYENRFYSSFNFMLDEPEDPFIAFGSKNYTKEENDSWYSFL